ncbi:unnamed protein product [Schistosoma mattheei]|uniref:DUF4139 domain-containing protein n=1 Tax=Schistosoma mattheei TaxID=31246 RepID=A0A3P7YC27_9TREM|nr:unnamed protein product [Schistosoma mattheei]
MEGVSATYCVYESEIRAVAPGEEFNCHLGAENGIKILYRPLFKYREGTGSSGKNATMTFKQLIEVRNTFDRRVRLMVVDQVPVSAEDKIKVRNSFLILLKPLIKTIVVGSCKMLALTIVICLVLEPYFSTTS